MPKLDKVIIKDLKEQRKEFAEKVNELEEIGIENMNHEESEDYGYYQGRVQMIDEILEKYK